MSAARIEPRYLEDAIAANGGTRPVCNLHYPAHPLHWVWDNRKGYGHWKRRCASGIQRPRRGQPAGSTKRLPRRGRPPRIVQPAPVEKPTTLEEAVVAWARRRLAEIPVLDRHDTIPVQYTLTVGVPGRDRQAAVFVYDIACAIRNWMRATGCSQTDLAQRWSQRSGNIDHQSRMRGLYRILKSESWQTTTMKVSDADSLLLAMDIRLGQSGVAVIPTEYALAVAMVEANAEVTEAVISKKEIARAAKRLLRFASGLAVGLHDGDPLSLLDAEPTLEPEADEAVA